MQVYKLAKRKKKNIPSMQPKQILKLYLNKTSLEYLLKSLEDIQFEFLSVLVINYLFLRLYCFSFGSKRLYSINLQRFKQLLFI